MRKGVVGEALSRGSRQIICLSSSLWILLLLLLLQTMMRILPWIALIIQIWISLFVRYTHCRVTCSKRNNKKKRRRRYKTAKKTDEPIWQDNVCEPVSRRKLTSWRMRGQQDGGKHTIMKINIISVTAAQHISPVLAAFSLTFSSSSFLHLLLSSQ